MALGVWQNTIRNSGGRVQPGAQVTVIDSSSGLPRDLFSDRDGDNAQDNPFYANDAGFARFYSAVGRVDIQIVSGSLVDTLADVVLIDHFP